MNSKNHILACSCLHFFQDKKFGNQRRVHNETKSGYRCTVCGDVKLKSAVRKKDNKDV